MEGNVSEKPVRKNAFPNSERESLSVVRKMKNYDQEYFELTDASPRHAFTKYMDEKGIKYDPNYLILIILLTFLIFL